MLLVIFLLKATHIKESDCSISCYKVLMVLLYSPLSYDSLYCSLYEFLLQLDEFLFIKFPFVCNFYVVPNSWDSHRLELLNTTLKIACEDNQVLYRKYWEPYHFLYAHWWGSAISYQILAPSVFWITGEEDFLLSFLGQIQVLVIGYLSFHQRASLSHGSLGSFDGSE